MNEFSKKIDEYKDRIYVSKDGIYGFFREYRWLSNFHKCQVRYEDLLYASSECAYQASKVVEEDRHRFLTCSAAESKTLWKTCENHWGSAANFDSHKYNIMAEILFDKFCRNADLKGKLLDTEDKHLEETNFWGDVYWGVDVNKGGENKLGEILMKIREFWR